MAMLATAWLVPALANAGPPYTTDDPEPVEYRHWEFYLATQDEVTADSVIGRTPSGSSSTASR
jgi:hypothetical protein